MGNSHFAMLMEIVPAAMQMSVSSGIESGSESVRVPSRYEYSRILF